MYGLKKKFVLFLSGITAPIALGQASLIFSTEADGIHSPVFILDSGDTSDDFIDLEFGSVIDAKLRYDVVNDDFVINRSVTILPPSGTSLLEIKTETDVGSGNNTAISFESDTDGTPNLAGIGQINDGALRLSGEGNLAVPDLIVVDDGDVGIGTDSPSDGSGAGGEDLKLDVEGALGAEKYCDEAGENCYDILDLAAGTIGTTMVDLAAARFTQTAVFNINATATDNLVPWDTQSFIEASAYTHDTVTNNSRIEVDHDGKYLVSGAVSVGGGSPRYNGKLKFRVNGATFVGPIFKPGYIRYASSQDETSLVFSLVLDLSAGDYFEILIDREGGTVAPVNMNPEESSLSIVQLKSVNKSAAPFISTTSLSASPSNTQTITINGKGFLPSSIVTIPGFPGTINTVNIVSPEQIDINITTTATLGTYDIVVDNEGVLNTTWAGNGVGLLEVILVSGTGSPGTYTESFESGLGSWVDSGLDVAWTRDSGGTPSGGTGPTVASVGTFYMFTEASSPNFPSKTFGLETTDFSVAQSISFDYHMYGAAMGDLEVQTLRSGVWTTRHTISGQQQAAQADAYLTQFISLSAFEVEAIRFFYTSGSNYTGDCTIDNVIIIST